MADERTGAGAVSLEHIIMKTLDQSFIRQLRALYENRYEPEYAHAFADIYWRTLLVVACIVVLGVGGFGAYTFFSALSQLNSTTATQSAIPTNAPIDQGKIETVEQSFAARLSDFAALQAGPVTAVPDPSK